MHGSNSYHAQLVLCARRERYCEVLRYPSAGHIGPSKIVSAHIIWPRADRDCETDSGIAVRDMSAVARNHSDEHQKHTMLILEGSMVV